MISECDRNREHISSSIEIEPITFECVQVSLYSIIINSKNANDTLPLMSLALSLSRSFFVLFHLVDLTRLEYQPQFVWC